MNKAEEEKPPQSEKSADLQELKLVSITWPVFLELFLFMLMGIADTLMLSAVSDNAVSGVGAANQYIFIAILILEVIGHGASIVVSQYLGAKQWLGASRISAVAVTLNLMAGAAISAGFLLFGSRLLSAVNLQGDILVHAQTYLAIVGGCLFLQAFINVLSSLIRTYGFTRETMLVSLGMNVFHVLLNYVLIFGRFGFPEMGVAGAAVSSVVSRAAGVLVFFWLFYRLMEIKPRLADYFNLTKEYVRKILKIGVPSAFESVTYHTCQSVFLYFVTFLGAEALASRQYAMNISNLIYLFNAAVGIGTAIITGRLVGAKRTEEAYRRVWVSLGWGFVVTLAVDITVIAFRDPIIGVFTSDQGIIRLTSQIIVLSIFLESGRTLNMILISSLRAAGDAKFPVYMGFISMIGISLPLGYFLSFRLNMGLAGIWLAIAADEWIRGILMFLRWRSRAWERRSLVGDAGSGIPAPDKGGSL
ncbi:MATE family efflux transporter [Paenibacillus thermotolerans]|uniref:MATE family efflux transporter n=1 Tax=Paenibacillus thermotolerans TaxID=3027807 RepID=UPI0023689373|nr:MULTISPECIES: MATE family efflux transporter [unclassified Paenibacillus]